MQLQRNPRAGGAALLDLVFACGLIAISAAVAIPSLQASRDREAAVMAARHLAGRVAALRFDAVRRNRAVAMRLDPDDLGQFSTYVDGDGDGVRQQDIDSGVDGVLERATHVSHFFERVSFAIPSAVPSPDGAEVIEANSDPVRIGNTNLLSFSPLGTTTSGTIYLASRGGTQVCVRILGVTGRVRVLQFDRVSGAWRQD